MGRTLDQAEVVRNALTSTESCSSATVSVLRNLLDTQHPSKENIQPRREENNGGDKRVRNTTRATAKVGGGSKANSKATFGTSVNVHEDKALNAREKYILAQETINFSLRTLTEALKPKPQACHQVLSKDRDGARKSSTSPRSSLNGKPLRPRQANEVSNDNGKPSALRQSSSSTSFAKQGPSTGVVAVAECARLAFAYLRSAQPEQPPAKALPALQIESGMLALVGRFVSLGFDTIAIKELCILKGRLEKIMKDESKKTNPCKSRKSGTDGTNSTKDRETLASLLFFNHMSLESSALPLVVSHQILVLRLIVAAKRPSITETVVEHLEPSSPCCPTSLVLRTISSGQPKEKVARQLQSLAQIYSSLCPSSSSSEDAAACNAKLHPSPCTAFTLQQLALETKIRWWGLVNHQANIDKELVEPMVKYLNAYANRDSTVPRQVYETAVKSSTKLRKLIEDWSNAQGKNLRDEYPWVSLESLLSTIAQNARDLEAAINHTQSALAASSKIGKPAEQTALSLRLATLVLEDRTISGLSPATDENARSERSIKAGLDCIAASMCCSDSSEKSQILVSIIALRRAAAKFLVKHAREPGLSSDSSGFNIIKLSRAIIFESLRFLVIFMKGVPNGTTCAEASLKASRSHALAVQVAKGIVDSVLGLLKRLIPANDIPWDVADSLLQDCATSVSLIESWTNIQANRLPQDFDPGQYLIKVSNLYWVFQSHQSKICISGDSNGCIQALIRSVDLLRPRSKTEQEAGLLAAKLEKLSAALYSASRALEAYNTLTEAIRVLIRSGVSQEVAKLLANDAPQVVWACDDQLGQLGRLLTALANRLKHGNQTGQDIGSFFDDSELTLAERGGLLEQQLYLISIGLSPRRPVEKHVLEALQTIIRRLFTIYTPSNFPIRRQRISRTMLQLATDYPAIWSEDILSPAMEDNFTSDKLNLAADAGLQKFHVHTQASWRVGQSFSKGLPKFETLKPALLDWQSIVDASSTWNDLLDRVDHVEAFTAQLQAIADFLDTQGLEIPRVAVLSLILRIEELRKMSNPTSLVISWTQLILQYLRLGYSGKAELALMNARSLMSLPSFSAEVNLQFQLTDAEHLLDVGKGDQCVAIMKKAALLATESPEIQRLSGPSATSSERVKYIKFAATSSSIFSAIALEAGDVEEALAQAKHSVKLYQRIWAILENKHLAKPIVPAAETAESDTETLTEEAARARLSSSPPSPVTSMTHERLRGPLFWPFVSSLARSLLHLAHVHGHMGMFQESVYYCEQAEKIANAVQADALLVNVRAKLSMYWTRSHRGREAQRLLEKGGEIKNNTSNTREMALYQHSMALLEHLRGNKEAELACVERALAIIEALISSRHIKTLDRLRSNETGLEEALSKVHLDSSDKQKTTLKSSKARRPHAKSVAKPSLNTKLQAREENKDGRECHRLAGSFAILLTGKAIILLLQGNLTEACEILLKAQVMLTGREDTILHQMANFRSLLAQATQLLTSDFNFNILPESSIAFPAIVRTENDIVNVLSDEYTCAVECQNDRSRSLSPRKGGRKAAPVKVDFITLLQQARDCIFEVHAKTLQNGDTSTIHSLCSMLGQVTILLSAARSTRPNTLSQPLAIAHSLEISKNHAVQSDINATAIDKRQSKRGKLLAWPNLDMLPGAPALLTASQFQRDYVDVIPEPWMAISISLDETRDEFYVTRYLAHETPFILRLPISRQKADDMDDDEPFTFEQGKNELLEIISLSNESTHDTRDMNMKGAKSAWWTEREVLDARLRDLLLNIENIWFGGFRGIFSQHHRHPHLLARFQKSFQNILDRYLPSRQGNSRGKSNRKGKNTSTSQPVTLDPRVLELFIGLGNANNDSLDLDEALMDLVYFIVDILQFNGERNAYDEIDFDAVVVETIDALKAYHEATSHEPTVTAPRHTILILDKQLHAFPWESLPCLDGLAVSRVPSMKALRDRIIVQRRQNQKSRRPSRTTSSEEDQQQQRFHLNLSQTSYILNPSGDLSHTEKVLSAPLKTLPPNPNCPTPCLPGRAPSEQDFESLLTQSNILLYFGHGSGAQYIRTRTVKRLSRCASAVWLMGCSSGAVTENGEFEPHGSVLGYLAAGWSNADGELRDMDAQLRESGHEEEETGEAREAGQNEDPNPCMAVCATLWDVTDKDIDRFSVRLGEEWGLWPEAGGERANAVTAGKVAKSSKTPRKMGRGRRDAKNDSEVEVRAGDAQRRKGRSLVESVARSRGECYLRYLNGAAPVVYGVPVWLD